MAGEAAAAGRTRGEEIDYNLRLGQVRMKLNAGLELEYDDNVNLADDRLPGELGPKEDFFLRPRLDIAASWQVTQINRLTLRLGLGYEFSLNDSRDSDVSPFTVAPDSEIGFDIFIGDVRINLHDRFSVENSPASQATVSNTGSYSRFMNTAGISALWDLNDVVVTGGYDYIIERYTGGSAEENDRDSHQLQLAVAFLLDQTTTTGIQSSALFSTGGVGTEGGEQTMLSIGPFLEFQVTPFTRLILSAGIQQSDSQGASSSSSFDDGRERFTIDENGQIVEADLTSETEEDDSGSDTGYYWSFAGHNKLNRWYTHSLTAGHERQVGFGSNYVDLDYIRYTANWLVNSNISLEFNTGLEHMEESQGIDPETLNRWFAGIGFSYRLRQNLSATFRYSYSSKKSELEFRDYQQNIVTVGFVYDF